MLSTLIVTLSIISVKLYLKNRFNVENYSRNGLIEIGRVREFNRGSRSGSSELIYESPQGEIQTFHIVPGYSAQVGDKMNIAYPDRHREQMVPVDFPLETGIPYPVAFLILAVSFQLPAWYLLKAKLIYDRA